VQYCFFFAAFPDIKTHGVADHGRQGRIQEQDKEYFTGYMSEEVGEKRGFLRDTAVSDNFQNKIYE
jgi:hypothetical protein